MNEIRVLATLFMALGVALSGEASEPAAGRVRINFELKLRTWDGFGLNYIEGGHTADPERDYEDYGGFSRLTETKRQEVMDLLYGPLDGRSSDVGLGLGLHKIFLDPHHQPAVDAPFVGASRSTEMSRYFLIEAAKRYRARGRTLLVLTTYYGAPAWATSTGKFHWRDVHPERRQALAAYLAEWVVFLRRDLAERGLGETVKIRAVGVTNEGEFPERWNADGSPKPGTDYNMYWHSSTLAEFLPILSRSLSEHGVGDVAIMPTETGGWDYFALTPAGDRIASGLLRSAAARGTIGMVGAHSFGPSGAVGAGALGMFRGALGEELQAWTTSHDWRTGDMALAESTRVQVCDIGVNGIITWAATKRVADWQRYTGRPPNPQCAVLVNEDGTTTVQSGYYFLKQTSLGGQPGMAVVPVEDRRGAGVRAMAFARNGTAHPDAFVVINPKGEAQAVEVELVGASATKFRAIRTRQGLRDGEACREVGPMSAKDGRLNYTAPAMSVTTFLAD